MTILEFYEGYFRPTALAGAQKNTVALYNACSHARWRHFRRKSFVFIYLRLVFNFLSVTAFVFPAGRIVGGGVAARSKSFFQVFINWLAK